MLEYVFHFVYQRQVITHGVEILNANTVRAAQLASIALFEEAKANREDLEWMISRYFCLERRFNDINILQRSVPESTQ